MAKLLPFVLFWLMMNACLPSFASRRAYNKHVHDASTAYSAGDYARAEHDYKEAIKIAKASGSETDQIVAMRGLAQLYAHTKRDAEAEAVFRQRIELGERSLNHSPRLLATTYDDLATFYILRGRMAEAKPVYERSISLLEQKFGPNSNEVVESLEYYSKLLNNLEQSYEAEQMQKRLELSKTRKSE
jgi:tetratricopeptide (TPR) repeat protein